MAYIINTSSTAATTLNLAQGRVQLAPRSYCELHAIDIERARRLYNSKELNLYIVETDKELELILGSKKEKSDQDETKTSAPDLNTQPVTNENIAGSTSDNSEPDETAQILALKNQYEQLTEKDAEETKSEIQDPNPEEEQKDTEQSQNDQNAMKLKLIEQVKLARMQGSIAVLKELATKLGIQFMPNIGIDKLTARILDSLQK